MVKAAARPAGDQSSCAPEIFATPSPEVTTLPQFLGNPYPKTSQKSSPQSDLEIVGNLCLTSTVCSERSTQAMDASNVKVRKRLFQWHASVVQAECIYPWGRGICQSEDSHAE